MSRNIPVELVSWERIEALARTLAFRIRDDGFQPDMIVAIARGGYVPARILCDYLGVMNLAGFRVEHYRGAHKEPLARVQYPLSAADGLRNAHGIDVPHRIIEDVLALLPQGHF